MQDEERTSLVRDSGQDWSEILGKTGQRFWARGYSVSTVGRDEETVRNYIKYQEEEDKRIDQLDLF